MATMQFRVSRDEFTNIVGALRRRDEFTNIVRVLPQRRGIDELQGTIEVLKTDEEKVEEVVDFFQAFMIEMENEDVLGFYNYDLVVDGETIALDAPDAGESTKRLKELVKSVWV